MFEENKVKVNTELTEHFNETETVKDKNGNDVFILKHIPYEQKQEFCRELAEMTLIADPDTGICYISALFEVVWNYLFIKYYTNIDVEWVQTSEDYGVLYDYIVSEELDYKRQTMKDMRLVEEYWERYSASIIRQYEAKHSLGQQVKELLSTDVNTNNAETRELIEKLIDMQEALKEKEEDKKVLQFAKKKADVPKVGGVKMSFAKKN
jgi:hypothetical protein